MSLKNNIAANYLSQFYSSIVGVVILPLYIRYMGTESFGLVGFFSMLQVWFSLLDMGLTPTMARETARFRGGVTTVVDYKHFARSLEILFIMLAIIGGCTIYMFSDVIAERWLKATTLPAIEISNAIKLMAPIIALRWMGGLYRGTITGMEHMVLLGIVNSTFVSFRFIGVLPVLIFIGATPTIFFGYQLCIALLECIALISINARISPTFPKSVRFSIQSFKRIRPVLKLAITIAFTSSVWVFVTQTDKLILSKTLTLSEYSYFTLAVLVASFISTICSPIGNAIMPRMVKLEAEHKHNELITLYRQSTQFVTLIAGSTSITLIYFAEKLCWAWTGDKIIAAHASPILSLYALGNGILAIAAFPYYLQYAKGNLKMHLIWNIIFVIILVPSIIWASSKFGGKGAGYVWVFNNVVAFIFWLPLVHHKFAPELNFKWYFKDIFPIVGAMSVVAFIAFRFLSFDTSSRVAQILLIAVFGGFTLLGGLTVATFYRNSLSTWMSKVRQRRL